MKNISRSLATFMVLVFFSHSVAFAVNPVGMAMNSHEAQSALKKITRLLTNHLDQLSEKQRDNFAYGTYRLAVKTRNKLAKMSERSFARKLHKASKKITNGKTFESEQVLTEEEAEVTEFLGVEKAVSLEERVVVSEQIQSLNRADLLDQSDAALNMFAGKTVDGKLQTISKSDFLKKLKSHGLRAPANDGWAEAILSVLLGIVIVGVLIVGVVAIISLGPTAGLIVLGAVCVGLVVAGVMVVIRAFGNT